MSHTSSGTGRDRLFRQVNTVLGAAILVVAGGCPAAPDTGPPTDNGNGNATGSLENVEGELINLRTKQVTSVLEPYLSIVYNLSGIPSDANVSAFYIRLDDASLGDGEEGERLDIVTALPSGENQAFRFYPQIAGTGSHRLGLTVTLGEDEREILSEAVVEVQGAPAPRFIQPTEPITEVGQGAEVFISFDAGDPQDIVQWRLFYLTATDSRDAPADRLGTQLDIGHGNEGSFPFTTVELTPGDYQLGLSATDSGDSVATTVAKGNEDLIITVLGAATSTPIIRITEETAIAPPTITFSAPATGGVELFGNEAFTIRFTATADPEGGEATIEVFLDLDTNVSNGFDSVLAENLPITATTAAFPTDKPEGTYFVGATVRQGSMMPVTSYAGGSITVARTPSLTVTAPNSSLPIRPSTPVDVRWTTNVPSSAGIVDVFAMALDEGGDPTGTEMQILPPSATSVTSTRWEGSDKSGLFEISVRITMNDSTIQTGGCVDGTCVQAAPQPVLVSSVPPILWLGSLAETNPPFEGAIFEGVNFEDNCGTTFSTVGDLNDDGLGEFLIGARYGKPFFINLTGVGMGEAYVIYGRTGAEKLAGEFNLNSVGTSGLKGVTFTGVRTPQGSNETDGMSSVSRLPDVDGDGKDELVFGFPSTDSRGHNVDPQQDGVVFPRAMATLEREEQFLRGGIVIVSSSNSILNNPEVGTPVINLDLVGQDFDETCVQPEPDDMLPADVGEFAVDAHNDVDGDPSDDCIGSCDDRRSGGKPDATEYIDFGFVAALARDYFSTYVYNFEFYFGVNRCVATNGDFVDHECLRMNPPRPHEYCTPSVSSCEPYSPGLHASAIDPEGFLFDVYGLPLGVRQSGFYPAFLTTEGGGGGSFANAPREPLGARIVGVGTGDAFGTSLTLSNATGSGAGDIMVSAPGRTARGILLGPFPSGCFDPPSCGGEIDGLESNIGTDSGVAYLFGLRSLWTQDSLGRLPPKPHQYIVGEGSHCGGPIPLIDNVDATRIAGFAGDRITNITGIDDFNNDGRNDFAIGAPAANSGQGRVYVAFRRGPGLEGDFVLEKLALDPNDPERLSGALLVTNSADALGSSLATGVDFNGDGISDLVVGSPDASSGAGEVIVVFGDRNLRTPQDGISIESLLTTRNASNQPRAARIRGNSRDPSGQFGFNVANAGDVDGDGLNDLLIAAPDATPRFDPDPTDGDDALSTPGVDVDLDGCPDDVSGPLGLPDGNDPCTEPDTNDELQNAGIVYVIYGSNRLDRIRTCENSDTACSSDADCDEGKVCESGDLTINIDQLGTSQLTGFIIVGRRAGDRLGGGDGGDTAQGGIAMKSGRGRSQGLASAGDVDGDGQADILIGSVLADPRRDPNTGVGVQNAGEAYLIYGSVAQSSGP